jgi:hypothetical protein
VREKRAEALPGSALEAHVQRVVRQTRMPVAARDCTGEHCADRPVLIPDLECKTHRFPSLDGGRGIGDQSMIERALEPVSCASQW